MIEELLFAKPSKDVPLLFVSHAETEVKWVAYLEDIAYKKDRFFVEARHLIQIFLPPLLN